MAKQHILTERTVDKDGGEVLIKRTLTRDSSNVEHFTRLYINDISRLGKVSGAEAMFLFLVHQFVEYDTNEFFLSQDRKEAIMVQSGLKVSTINCCISRLTKKKFLIRKSSNHYQLNPQFFFYGTEVKRATQLELTIEYRITDKEPELKGKPNLKGEKERGTSITEDLG